MIEYMLEIKQGLKELQQKEWGLRWLTLWMCSAFHCREPYRAVLAALREGLLKRDFILRPAVGDKEAHYRRVVDSWRSVPGQHKSSSVQRVGLHVVRDAAADWMERGEERSDKTDKNKEEEGTVQLFSFD